MEKGKPAQKQNKASATDIEKNMSSVIQGLKSSEPSFKEELKDIKIENASEVKIGEDGKHCYLVQIACSDEKNLKKIHSLLVKKLEERFSTPIVIIPHKKRINGKIFKRYHGTKVPRDRTLSAVFDSYLDDLLYPATIIGKRIRYPKGKVRHFKVFVDHLDKDAVEYKVPSITACYKALTNRELDIEFPEPQH